MLGNIRRGPFAAPTETEQIQYLLTRVRSDRHHADVENHCMEHVLSYQRRVAEIKVIFTRWFGLARQQASHLAYQRGGRVVISQLEFDVGIIDRELETASMHHWRPQWHAMAQAGFFTMVLVVGKWI